MKAMNKSANRANKGAFSMIELVFVIVIIGIMAGVSVWYLPRTELKQATETMMTNLKYTKTLAQLDDRYFAMSDEQYFNTIGTNLTAAQKELAMKNQVQNWRKGMWQFQFHSTNNTTSQQSAQNTYTIYAEHASSSATTNFDGKPMNGDTIAKDPMTKECISGYGTNSGNLSDCKAFAKEARFYDTFQTELADIKSQANCKWTKNNTFAIYFDNKGNPYCKATNNGDIQPLTESITIELKRKSENAYICITKGGIIDSGNVSGSKDSDNRTRGIAVTNGKCEDVN